jgi:catechol 2,3-dioxygenase-like lactoylglutathione lyase family enzyme
VIGMQLDHVQVAIPAGGEADARRFFSEVLGLAELAKPAQLGPGGCWFQLGDRQLHIGVDPDFRAARKAPSPSPISLRYERSWREPVTKSTTTCRWMAGLVSSPTIHSAIG